MSARYKWLEQSVKEIADIQLEINLPDIEVKEIVERLIYNNDLEQRIEKGTIEKEIMEFRKEAEANKEMEKAEYYLD